MLFFVKNFAVIKLYTNFAEQRYNVKDFSQQGYKPKILFPRCSRGIFLSKSCYILFMMQI